MKTITLATLGALLLSPAVFAQTHLPAGSDAASGFGVGTMANPGGLVVTGQTGNSATPGIAVVGDGGVVFSGIYGTGTIPATGAGVRLMWYSKKAAFRAGNAVGSNWDDGNVGNYSAAFGTSTKASGTGSVAIGSSTIASGPYSLAIGNSTTASAEDSIATGFFGSSTSLGAFSGGLGSIASGSHSIAYGQAAQASGANSVAFNLGSNVSGGNSAGFGYMPVVSAGSAFAAGYKTTASAFSSFVIGRNNVVEGNANSWVDTDPLFVVGNGYQPFYGTVGVTYHNAFTIYKNGKIKMDRQGDILMGDFGTPGSND